MRAETVVTQLRWWLEHEPDLPWLKVDRVIVAAIADAVEELLTQDKATD